MPEASQFTFDHRELLELLIKHANVHEGRWMLMATFGIAPGNYGPSPDQVVPGIAVAMQKIGIQRAGVDTPVGMTLDASDVNPLPKVRKATAKTRKAPASKRGKKP